MKKNIYNITIWVLFVVYLIILIWVLFISPKRFYDITTQQYFRAFTNLIPFKTFKEYYHLIEANQINISIVITTLLKNIIAFIPLGLFLPCLYSKIYNYKKTLIWSCVFILLFRFARLLLMLGSFDVDFIIVNLMGVSLGYAFLKIRPIKRIFILISKFIDLINKIFTEKNSKPIEVKGEKQK